MGERAAWLVFLRRRRSRPEDLMVMADSVTGCATGKFSHECLRVVGLGPGPLSLQKGCVFLEVSSIFFLAFLWKKARYSLSLSVNPYTIPV